MPILEIELLLFLLLYSLLYYKLDRTTHTILHDLQQIKTRLTWSRKREKKDLKAEIIYRKPRKQG